MDDIRTGQLPPTCQKRYCLKQLTPVRSRNISDIVVEQIKLFCWTFASPNPASKNTNGKYANERGTSY
jgi:hypothetical protein